MVNVGDNIKGIVRIVTEFGLFVEDEEGFDYLLALHELWWDRRGLPSDFASVGDEITFQVTLIDDDQRRRLGSPKLAFPELDAWRDPTVFEVGKEFQGSVVQIMSYGIFIRHPRGPDGLLHVSSYDSQQVSINIGDLLDVRIIGSDAKGRQFQVELINSAE